MIWWRWLGMAGCCSVIATMVLTHRGGRRQGLRILSSALAAYAMNLGVVQLGLTIGGKFGMLASLPLIAAACWFGRSPLGVLNFLVLQWFGVRLQAEFSREEWLKGPRGRWWANDAPTHGPIAWSLLRWIWPLTGWWSRYRYIPFDHPRNPK